MERKRKEGGLSVRATPTSPLLYSSSSSCLSCCAVCDRWNKPEKRLYVCSCLFFFLLLLQTIPSVHVVGATGWLAEALITHHDHHQFFEKIPTDLLIISLDSTQRLKQKKTNKRI